MVGLLVGCGGGDPPLGPPHTWERIALEGGGEAGWVNAIVFESDEDVRVFGASPEGHHWRWRGEAMAPRTAAPFPIEGAARRDDGTIVVCGGRAEDGRLGRLVGDNVEQIGDPWPQRFLDCSPQLAVGEVGVIAAWTDDGAELVRQPTLATDALRGVWDDGPGTGWIASYAAVYRWDGGETTVVMDSGGVGSGFYDVAGDGDHVWAVTGEPYARVAHTEGGDWTAGDPFELSANWYEEVAVRGRDDVWIAGQLHQGVGHWDGSAWTEIDIPAELLDFGDDDIPDVKALEIAPSGDIWIGGSDASGALLLRGRR